MSPIQELLNYPNFTNRQQISSSTFCEPLPLMTIELKPVLIPYWKTCLVIVAYLNDKDHLSSLHDNYYRTLWINSKSLLKWRSKYIWIYACSQLRGWNSSVAMLAAKRSAGVTPEVNLRIVLHTGDEAYKPGDPSLALKRRIDVTRSPKTGVSVTPQKWHDALHKFLKKSELEQNQPF